MSSKISLAVILDGDVNVVGALCGGGLDIQALLLTLPKASVLVLVNFPLHSSFGILSDCSVPIHDPVVKVLRKVKSGKPLLDTDISA
jgi:hypothetical protein